MIHCICIMFDNYDIYIMIVYYDTLYMYYDCVL